MRNQLQGFALIGLMIAVAIIAILMVIYYQGTGGSKNSSPAKTGREAIEQAKKNNQLQIEQHLEIQNQLNSIE